MNRLYVLVLFLVAMAPLLCLADEYNVSQPLYLTSLIDAGNITEAVEACKVVDPCNVSDPGQDCGVSIPDSYAGFLTVNKTLENHLFFWYFPAQVSNFIEVLMFTATTLQLLLVLLLPFYYYHC